MILLKTLIQTILYHKKLASCVPCVATNCIVLRKISSTTTSYTKSTLSERLINGPGLSEFINKSNTYEPNDKICFQNAPYLNPSSWQGYNRKVFFDVYGCQMNVNDTEIVWSILQEAGFLKTNSLEDADVVLVMTCAIREGAENKVWNNLRSLRSVKYKKRKGKLKIGILGCMAERLKHELLEKEKSVDIVAGPDSYKDLPRLLAVTENNQTAVNVLLSLDETYADVMPVRLNDNCKTAFVSIMRGCDNMCTYCIVPFTRGRERSRPISSILNEVKHLSEEGVKEITLLGQNVNSYRDISETSYAMEETKLAKGFKTVYKDKKGGLRFAELLDKVANVDTDMRIRFTSPHPKDFPDQVLELIRDQKNVCCSLHLPAQSGSSSVLERMRRGYNREAYLDLVSHAKSILPSVSISSDFICGFCGETEEEFNETLTLLETVKFNVTYLFAYSMREKTTAHRRFQDDVPPDVKKRRLIEMHSVFRKEAESVNRGFIGDIQLVLVEGTSKRSNVEWAGRNDGNIKVIIPSVPVPVFKYSDSLSPIKPGDYVAVRVDSSNSQVLKGTPLYHATISTF